MEYLEPFLREGTVSARWLMPFMRATGCKAANTKWPERLTPTAKSFGDPLARVGHVDAMAAIENAVLATGDPRLGLRAALQWVPGELDAVELASRSAPTLRDAIQFTSNHLFLIHGGQRLLLREDDRLAIWELRSSDAVRLVPAANDYVLTMAMLYSRAYASRTSAIRTVLFEHESPTDLDEYRRLFPHAEIRMGASHNALIFDRSQLDAPMQMANRGLHAVFAQRVLEQTESVIQTQLLSCRLRETIRSQLHRGDPSMTQTARSMAMSVATLRRRLANERIIYRTLLDDVRRELTEILILESSLAMKEVSARVGFAHVTAFYKAFARWFPGTSPLELRASRGAGYLGRAPSDGS